MTTESSPSQQSNTGVPAAADMPVLSLVTFIIDWAKSQGISEIFDESRIHFHFICKGRGTASSDVLDLLGLGSGEKAVVFCLEQNFLIPALLKRVNRKLALNNPGAGIAFSIPLSGIAKPILMVFKDAQKRINERRDRRMNQKHELIVIIANQGYSEELMACAKEAGASGGTVVSARGTAHQGPVQVFGVTVQDEKELIIILSGRSKHVSIMQAVSQKYGPGTKAGSIVFSLPAENITGLDLDEPRVM